MFSLLLLGAGRIITCMLWIKISPGMLLQLSLLRHFSPKYWYTRSPPLQRNVPLMCIEKAEKWSRNHRLSQVEQSKEIPSTLTSVRDVMFFRNELEIVVKLLFAKLSRLILLLYKNILGSIALSPHPLISTADRSERESKNPTEKLEPTLAFLIVSFPCGVGNPEILVMFNPENVSDCVDAIIPPSMVKESSSTNVENALLGRPLVKLQPVILNSLM